jgi:hypothetical protein
MTNTNKNSLESPSDQILKPGKASVNSLDVARARAWQSSKQDSTTTKSLFPELVAKSKGPLDLHSTTALGNAAALVAKVKDADKKANAVELNPATTAESRQEANVQRTGLYRVSGPPSLTVVQGGGSDENRSPIRRLGSSGFLSQNASQQSLERHDSAMDGISDQEQLRDSFDFKRELEQHRAGPQGTGTRGLEDRLESDRTSAPGGRV